MEYLAQIIVRDKDGTEIKRVGVSSLAPRYIEQVMRGMLRNLRDGYWIDDSEVDETRAALADGLKAKN